MTQEFTSLLLSLAPYIVPLIAALLFPFVKSLLDKLPAASRARLSDIVSTAVNATEQVMAPDASPTQKKSEAIRRIEAQLAQAKLNIPATVYDSMIEEAVLLLNILQGKPKDASVPTPSPCPDAQPSGERPERPTVVMSKFPGESMPPFVKDATPSGKQGAE
jgi:hypothetical protein